jgi:hypothetical protein
MRIEITRCEISKIVEKTNLVKNLARLKMLSLLILALLECKNVLFSELSLHIKNGTKTNSNFRRIQRFFQKVSFDEKTLAQFLLSMMPAAKVILCIDRTNWKIGIYKCNILMITAYFNGIGLPLYWQLLENKGGNSATQQRIDLIEKCIDLLGVDRIKCLIADREFIGFQWFRWLKNNKIDFCIRLPKSHWIKHKGQEFKAESWLKDGQFRVLRGVEVEGIVCNIFGEKLENGEFLLLAGTGFAKKLGEIYRKRWSIEVCFKAFKTHGFQLENTHLQEAKKLHTLIALVSIALILCIKLGFLVHNKHKKIKVKKHGYKANSFFRVGLDTWRKLIKGQELELMCYVKILLSDIQKTRKNANIFT